MTWQKPARSIRASRGVASHLDASGATVGTSTARRHAARAAGKVDNSQRLRHAPRAHAVGSPLHGDRSTDR